MKWQGQCPRDNASLGSIIFEFAGAAPLAEVLTAMGDSTEFCSYNFILYIQVLQVVNPNISYSLPGSTTKIDGVAVTLKEFLKAVDSYSIENDGEKDVRRVLCGHPRCETRKKQFFNTTNSKKNTMIGTTKMCQVPHLRVSMPDGFFDLLNKSAQDGTGHGND